MPGLHSQTVFVGASVAATAGVAVGVDVLAGDDDPPQERTTAVNRHNATTVVAALPVRSERCLTKSQPFIVDNLAK